MPYGNTNSAETWLRENLCKEDTSRGISLLGAPDNGFRLRVLRLMLAIAAVAVAVTWYQEANNNLINGLDRIAYPVLLAVTTFGALLLTVWPATLRVILATVFSTLIVYLVVDCYYISAYQTVAGQTTSYEFATLALWLPLGYVGSYVFFSPRAAMHTSLGIYAAISLPQWMLLGGEMNMIDRQIVIAMLVSHPVYIAALWGVAQLKLHARDVQDLAQSMSVAAAEDPLTGVANRRAMLYAMETVMRMPSSTDRPLALLLFDVDRFKGINDKFGHAVGDDVLRMLAQRTKALMRASDLLGRWGGEEFIILALDQNQAQALHMAERLRSELERISYLRVGTVTVSIGVTVYIPNESVEAFFKRADDALYHAKEQGRNRVEGLFGSTTGHP